MNLQDIREGWPMWCVTIRTHSNYNAEVAIYIRAPRQTVAIKDAVEIYDAHGDNGLARVDCELAAWKHHEEYCTPAHATDLS